MNTDAVAAGLALFALGANFLGTTLLLLFNPGGRSVRWYAAFNVAVMTWLGIQGVSLLFGRAPWDVAAYGVAVQMMPSLFLGATLVQAISGPRARWLPWIPVAVGAALLLVFDPITSRAATAWQVLGWSGAAAVFIVRTMLGRGRQTKQSTRREKVLETVLSGLVPIGVAGAIMVRGGFILFVLPAVTIAAMLLVFVGVLRHRYYDIEIRAARTGELAAAAAEHDRLALLGELAATIAHEVRNPLTGIRSLTEQLAESPVDDGRRARYTDVILGEISRLDRIVGNLTDLSRRSSSSIGTAAVLPVMPLFEDLALLVEPRARRRSVRVVAEPTDSLVLTSREALAQALLNLLLNAVDHAPPHSTVALAAARTDGRLVLSVRDAGPGVPPDQRTRIFEPFHTAGGTGLGLTVVRRLASEHGWLLAVVDAPGGGAEFRITVDAAEPALT